MTLVILTMMTGCGNQAPAPAENVDAAAPKAPKAEPEAPAASAMAIPERGADDERGSKNGSLSHEVGGAKVEVRFGRPEMRGRQIFGGIVSYGSIWRTGADEAAVFATESDLLVQGDELPAGVYALFTIPNETEWTVIFNKVPKQWGAFKYDQDQDALRVTTTPAAAEPVEAFDVQGTEDGIALRWAEVSVPLTIAANPGSAEHADHDHADHGDHDH